MKAPKIVADHQPAVKEIHVVWMTTGLSCDGDSVSVTAATLPSIEDVVMGAIPGLPKVHLHNPVLAYEVGDDFMKYWHARRGRLDPFVLVLEGSVPNEKIKKEGYWAAMGTDPDTGQPITTNEWIDRLAPKATAVIAAGTCATYGGIHAMEGNPTGAMGLADYLGWNWRSKAGLPIVNVPGCPVQPDNMMETLLYLLYQVAGLAPMIPLDDQLRPTWLFGKTVHEGCDRGALLRAGRLCPRIRLAQVPGENRLLGAGGELQRDQARLDGWHRRLSERRRHLHRLHHARVSRTSSCPSWMNRLGRRSRARSSARMAGSSATLARHHQPHREQGTEMAAPAARAHHRLQAKILRPRQSRMKF